MIYAPYRKPSLAVNAVNWNAAMASLSGEVQRGLLRSSVVTVLNQLPHISGIDLALAIVFLKRAHDADKLAGTITPNAKIAQHFQSLKLTLNMEERVHQTEARAFRNPPLTLAEVCFFLSIGVKQDLLRIGRSMPKQAVCMKTLRGWQDVFTLSKHYQPAPRLHDGCQTSHPLDTLNDGNFTKKMPKKKTNALEVGTEIMHRISTRKRPAHTNVHTQSKQARRIDDKGASECIYKLRHGGASECTNELRRDSILQVFTSRNEHERGLRFVKFPDINQDAVPHGYCLVFNYEHRRVMTLRITALVRANDQSIAAFLTAYARIHYTCYYSSLSKASEESFKQVRQSLLRDYHPDKLGRLGTLFSAIPGMELQRPIDYVYECISARRQ